MKKTFRSILAGALALLAVSCYDDSGLRDDIKKLDERVTALETTLNAEVASVNDLAAKLTAAQTAITNLQESVGTLGTDLAALKSTVNSILPRLDAVDGETDGKIANLEAAIAALEAADDEFDADLAEAIAKIAVTKVEEKGGNVVLTLATGGEVVLSKPMSNVDNNGLVTIVEDEEGIRHWAIVGADGTTEMLPFVVGAAGTIEFKVEDNELMFTLNGEDWATTGAYVTDDSSLLLTDFYQGFTGEYDMDTYEPIKNDFYTLVFGGVEYQLPLYKVDDSVVAIKTGKTYFTYGQNFTVDVVVKNMISAYLMWKPDGWKAKFANNVLTVTAPTQEAVESGDAEKEGEILIHCTTSEGKCKVARLVVSMTPDFVFTVTEDGKVTIVNPEVVTTTHPMTGMTFTDFNSVYMGFAPVSKFEADPLKYVSTIENNYDDYTWQLDNFKGYYTEYDEETYQPIYQFGGAYDPETYTVDRIEATVNDFHNYIAYSDVPKGTSYVFWACPADSEGKPRLDDLSYVYYSVPVEATITAIEGGVSTSDIEVEVKVDGAQTYYVGIVADEYMFDYMTGQKYEIDEYMVSESGPFGYMKYMLNMGAPAEYALQGMGTCFGGESGMEMPATIKASQLFEGALSPEMKVYMWVLPIIDGLELASYNYEENLKPYIYEFTTNGLQPGGSAAVVFGDANLSFASMIVDVAAEGASMIYYNYFTPDQYNAFEDDASMSAALLEEGYVLGADEGVAVNRLKVSPGAEFYLVALAVDAEGKYGEITSQAYKAPSITFSETFKATFGETKSAVYYSGYKYDFPIIVEGGSAAKYYYVWSTAEFSDELLAKLPLGSSAENDYSFKNSTNVAAGQLAGQYANASSTYYLAVVVESTTGELSPVVKMTVEVPAVPAAE